jgi:hypothetical protein
VDVGGSDLKAEQLQLEGLKGLLVGFYARHGRYPMNEEGLGALEFPHRLAAKLYLSRVVPGGLGMPR